MNLYIDNHSFHYEMENLTRAFLFDEPVTVIRSWENFEKPYILTCVRDDVRVTLSAGSFEKTLSEPRGEDDELSMARLLYFLLSDYCGKTLPWGVLTGVRPIKLFSSLSASRGVSYAEDYFQSRLLVSGEKTALSRSVSAAQKPILDRSSRKSFSLYVSIPFCPTRCNYCSFVSQSVEKAKRLISDYIPLLLDEIRLTAKIASDLGLRLASVYVGGGTPTTLSAGDLSLLLSEIRADFDMSASSEFTVEAGRPDTVTAEKLLALKETGVSRISINPQTFNDDVLSAIGRRHTTEETLAAFSLARSLGFSNINMDLIAGLLSDTPESFCHSIDSALSLSPESITVHTLAVKRSARLSAGDVSRAFSAVSDMLSYAGKRLPSCGYIPYYLYRQSKMLSNLENIGWAKEGFFSPYNIYIMEETHSILACGAGAVTKLRDADSNHLERIFNFKYPYEYITRFDELAERKSRVYSFYQEYNN